MKKTLAEELLELNPSTDFDIEDDIISEASGSESDDAGKTDHYVTTGKSSLRDNSARSVYGGTKVSRSQLYKNSANDIDSESNSEDEESGEISSVYESDEDEGEDSEDSEDSDKSEEVEESDESEENKIKESEDINSRNKLKQIIKNERQTIGKRVAQSNINDALKGYSVANQNKLFDHLIETRIKLQKCLNDANLLPGDYNTSKPFRDEQTDEYLKTIESKCYDVLEKIITLRCKMTTQKPPPLKKRKLSYFNEATTKLDEHLKQSRSTILTKWSTRVNNSSGSNALNASKFKVINQSAEQQILNNLNDMNRLKRRTYLNRSSIKPLGYEDSSKDHENSTKNLGVNEISQIFNDEDFYRLLLNDLVDKKISNPVSNIALLKKNQKAIKNNKNIDTKASKGRKLKFNVQDPIAHFEAPVEVKWQDYQIDELLGSLFGQKIHMGEVDEVDQELDKDSIKLFT